MCALVHQVDIAKIYVNFPILLNFEHIFILKHFKSVTNILRHIVYPQIIVLL